MTGQLREDDRLDPETIAGAALSAAERIAGTVVRTPLRPYRLLSERVGANIQLKLENEQHTGSFKFRGAVNRLLTLDDATRRAGVVVASSGNHGAAVARAMRDLGTGGVIFVPEKVSSQKLATIRDLGADVRLYGDNGLDTELQAREYAATHGMFYLSPYNDPEVIAGQGTIGVELLADMPDIDVAVIAVGGGGLIAGVASVLKSARPAIRIVAVQPEASPVMALSVRAGKIIETDETPTLSDGTAGGIEAGAITFEPVQTLADEFVLVPEYDIAVALRDLEKEEGLVVEGAAALTLAAINADAASYRDKNVVALICGGNIAPETLELAHALAGAAD
jgi:threonine dehydratase